MNPFILEFLTSSLRSFVGYAGSALVTYGVITLEQSHSWVDANTPVLAGIILVTVTRAVKAYSLIKGAKALESLKDNPSFPVSTNSQADAVAKAVLGQKK